MLSLSRILRIALTATLLLFVGATVGLLIAQETSQGSMAAGGALANNDTIDSTACIVDVVYFHTTQRCAACLNIEEEARAIIEQAFSDEVSSGSLRWSAVNMDIDRQAIVQFDLVMPTLVLVRRMGGEIAEWESLDDTWRLIGSQVRFSAYVRDRVAAFVRGCP